MNMEKWKTIKGLEAYEVSNLGKVRSVDRQVRCSRGVGTRLWKGRPIATSMDSRNRYRIVTFNMDGKSVTRLLHVVVAKAFVPNPLNLPQVNHKDGIKTHCEATNLEWRTCLGNHRHALKLGLAGDSLYFDKRRNAWAVKYSPEPYTVKYIGSFPTKREALAARRAAVKALPEVL